MIGSIFMLPVYIILDPYCQNLGAASSNPVQTRQDTIDVDCVLGMIEKRESERKTHFVCLSSSSIGYYWLVIIL